MITISVNTCVRVRGCKTDEDRLHKTNFVGEVSAVSENTASAQTRSSKDIKFRTQ